MRDSKDFQTRVRPEHPIVVPTSTVTRGRQTPTECIMSDCTNKIPRYGIMCPKCYKKVNGIMEHPQDENA